MKLNGGQALIKSLEMEGVEVMFGLPGGAHPARCTTRSSTRPIRHILVRHEQGAGHMAEGYAHATGRPGVAMVTSGPAATNIVTPLCDAYMDSIPMVVITGQVPTAAIGTDAFQECDTDRHHPVGHQAQRAGHRRPRTSPGSSARRSTSPPPAGPGPVLVDIPKDIVDPEEPDSAMDWYWPTDDELRDGLPGYKPDHEGPPAQDPGGGRADPRRRAARSSTPAAASSRPGPPRRCASWPSCTDIHVVTTLMARGAFPDDHPLCLGMPGMHGNYTAVTSMQKADLLIALGSRFDDRVTGKVGDVRPRRQDHPRRHRPGRAGQGAPARRARSSATAGSSSRSWCRPSRDLLDGGADAQPDRTRVEADDLAAGRRSTRSPTSSPSRATPLKPQFVLEQLRDNTPDDTHRRRRASASTRCGPAVLEVQPPLHVGELRRPRHDGLRRARRHRRQGRPARPHGVGRRRRRLLPDDRPGAGHRGGRAHPGQGRHPQQRLPRHGPPVAGDVLRGALLRGVPVARPARLQDVGRGDGLRRHAGRVARGGRSRPSRRPTRSTTGPVVIDFRTDSAREGVPDGAGRRVERRHRRRPQLQGEGVVQ